MVCCEIALCLFAYRLGLRIGGKFIHLEVGLAQQLRQRIVLALQRKLVLQLRCNEAAGGTVEICLRAGTAFDQRILALDFAPLEFDILGRKFRQFCQNRQVGFQGVELCLDRHKFGIRLRERETVGFRVDLKQFVAGLDLLPFPHKDIDHLSGNVRRDQNFLCTDIRIVGRDVTAPMR